MLQVENLVKCYGYNRALDGVSFSVEEGEVLGLLGPNGAGKSTTMNIITGFLGADGGSVRVNGFDMERDPTKAKRDLGYLPENPPLYEEMTVKEYLKFVAELKNTPWVGRSKMLKDIMESVKIEEVKARLIRNLSKGYKQRVGFAQALVGYPRLLVLDEPTVALDPKQIMEVRDLIQELGKKHTIVLSSHILSEVSAVCDRVAIVGHGTIVAQGTPERLSDKMSQGSRLKIKARGEKLLIEQALQRDPRISRVEQLESAEEGTYDFAVEAMEGTDSREVVFQNAINNGYILLLMKAVTITLEDIFLHVTNEDTGIAFQEEAQAPKPPMPLLEDVPEKQQREEE